MHKKLYFLFAMGALSALTIGQAQAATTTANTESTEISMLDLGSGKKATSPEKLDRQLHHRQQQLKAKARHTSRANRRRYQHG